MNRLGLVILKKDLRRLWWESLVSFIVVAALTWFDSRRYDFVPGPTEAMLNFLAPAVWAYLIAMLVHQEALVGDRQFWLTRPYPRAALLGAKLLGAILLVHVPAFLSDCVILWSHNFSPFNYLPQLAWKQAIIAGVLTFPALAIAAVTRNLPQFAFAAALAALAGTLLMGSVEPFSAPWLRTDTLRRVLATAVICAGAALVLTIQYRSRRTALARTVGALAAASAAALFLLLPVQVPAAPSSTGEIGNIAVNLAPDRSIPYRDSPGPMRQIYIPVQITGAPEGDVRFQQIRFVIRTASGETWMMKPISTEPGLTAQILREYQIIAMPHDMFARALQEPITVEATLAALVMAGDATTILSHSPPTNIPRLGRCMSGLADLGLLRVLCESPEAPPRAAVVLRRGMETFGRQQMLGDSAPYLRYPLFLWLSPLHRRQTFFHIREYVSPEPGNQWLVPASALDGSELVLTHATEVRRIISYYRLGPFRLTDYLRPESRGSMNLR
jgi:hypothetical protein